MINERVPINEFRNLAGKDLGYSQWLKIDQKRIDLFAQATEDYQFIHVDKEKAAQTPMGTTIAHGFLTLSLISHLTAQTTVVPEGYKMTYNYGLNKLRFLSPVPVDSEVRTHVKIDIIEEKKPGQFRVESTVTVEIKGQEKPALVAESLAMHFCDILE